MNRYLHRVYISKAMHIALLFFCLLLFAVKPAISAENNSLQKVTVQFSWKHQFEFAQVIAAYEKGFYREAGLDVEIIEGGPGINPVDIVVSGKADYGVFSSALVVEYARGKPVVALAALMQHSAVGIIVKNTNTVRSVHDLAGKQIAVSTDTRDEIVAYLQAMGLKSNDLRVVQKTSTGLKDLAHAAAISTYISNEGYLVAGKEKHYQVLTPRSAGIDFFGNVLFTSKKHVDKHPGQIKKFITATLRGVEYSINNHDEIIDIILKKYNTQNKSRDHLQFEAWKIAELTRPDIVEPGYMSSGRWQHVADTYALFGKVPADLDLEDFIYNPDKPVDIRPYYGVIVASFSLLVIVSTFLWQSRRFNLQLQHEINERQQAEVLLRESESHFKDLFENNPDPCWLIDDDTIVECNQAAVHVLGYPDKKSLETLHISDVSPDKQPDGSSSRELADKMIAITRQQGIHRFEWTFNKKNDGYFPAEVTLARTHTGRRPLLYCIWRDISERKRIDRFKDDFVATVSHEIRTPLTSILGSLKLLDSNVLGSLPESIRSMIDISLKNTDRLLALINDLLDMSSLESGRLEYHMSRCDLNEIIQQSIMNNELFARQHNVEYRLSPYPGKAFVYADKDRLMQVMSNLLTNAARFSSNSGEVDIALERDKDIYLIKVRDYGIGIPEKFHKKVFKKFTQVDSSDSRRSGGTGLGLSIARAIVREHKGSISFSSVEGKGTEFTVGLPVHREQ